ncbi:hypothetical protein [Pedobacter agri]|uniref:hypothetical protein n=1 Tax=Pedobacter agri TaxID=454586 RepID=UPI00292DCC7E|nr:hypothetical protein [Pedobacter agri]
MNDQKQILKYLTDGITTKLYKISPDVRPILLNKFWLALISVLRSDAHSSHIAEGPIVYIVDDKMEVSKTDIDMLDPVNLKLFFQSGISRIKNTIIVDYFGKATTANPYKDEYFSNIEEVSEFSDQNDGIFIFAKGVEVTIFHDGKLIKHIPDIYSTNTVGQIKSMLPISEFKKLLLKHYHEEIVGERGLLYWKNKKDRTLISSPEDKFRTKLANFLDNNVSDGLVDEECRNDNSNDRNDVRVVTLPNSNVFIFEIKWIGKSEGADYDGAMANTKANEGLEQLELYIDGEKRCVCGILVIYDARKDNIEIDWQRKPELWHAVVEQPPILMHLDPTSSSEKAKIIVKNAK